MLEIARHLVAERWPMRSSTGGALRTVIPAYIHIWNDFLGAQVALCGEYSPANSVSERFALHFDNLLCANCLAELQRKAEPRCPGADSLYRIV